MSPAGHKGASHHGHALSARSRSSHLTATQHARAHHLNHALAHNRFARFSTAARQVTITRDVDTPAEKALPPGIELNVDRGKAVAMAGGCHGHNYGTNAEMVIDGAYLHFPKTVETSFFGRSILIGQ